MTKRKMKDSGVAWIGQVPEGWSVERVKYYFEVITGNGFKPELQGLTDGDYPVCKASDIAQCARDLYSSANWITKEIAKIERFNVIPNGSILFPKIGEAMKKNSRAIARVNCCADNNCQGLLAKGIDVEYSYYLFLCIDMNWFDNAGTIPCLNNQKLKGSSIPYPLISEQRKIAAFLDGEYGKIDVLRGKVEKQISALEEYRKSVITEAVTKGIKRGRKMKPSGVEWIGEVPEDWAVRAFRFDFSFSKGLNITKANLVDAGVPVVSYGQIHAKYNSARHLTDRMLRFVPEAIAERGFDSRLNWGDFVFADTSEDIDGVGNFVLNDRDDIVYAGYHDLVARPNDPQNAVYLAYLFQTDAWRSQLRSMAQGIKVFSITQRLFKKVTIIRPALSEQHEIAAYLDRKCAAIDSMVGKCREELDRLAEYKKSLIYEYVTGKKEVA